jgi:hypothetical protein
MKWNTRIQQQKTTGTATDEKITLPDMKALSADSLVPYGVYLIDNGHELILWMGKDVESGWLQSVFGVNSLEEINFELGGEALLARRGNEVRRRKQLRIRGNEVRSNSLRLRDYCSS